MTTPNFLDSVVVRRGGLGAVLVTRGGGKERGDFYALSVPAVSGLRPRDTTGCGNAFLGGLAAAAGAARLRDLDDLSLALGIASASAAAVAEVVGTPQLSRELFEQPSSALVERAAERAMAVRNLCAEVEVV